MSEIERREAEIRKLAASCVTLRDLSRKTGWNMETVIHWDRELKLGLVPVKLAQGGKREAQAVPKPKPKDRK